MKTENKSNVLRWILVGVFLALEFGIIAYAIRGSMNTPERREVAGYTEWDQETVELAETIPVQDGGRLKPLGSFARFRMLSLYGALKMPLEAGGEKLKIGPTEWLLDCLFRPELAKELPVFRVDNTTVLEGMGLKVGERRDRLSFSDIAPIYETLIQRGRAAQEKLEREGKDAVTLEEKQINEIANQVLQFQGLITSLDFAREGMPVDPADFPADAENKEALTRFSYWFAAFPVLQQAAMKEQEETGALSERTRKILGTMETFIIRSRFGVNWIPNYKEEQEEWIPLGTRLMSLIEREESYWQDAVADLKQLEDLVQAHKEGDFKKELTAWRDSIVERAGDPGLLDNIEQEASFYRANYFKKALVYFIIAFVIGALGWFAPQSRPGRIFYWLSVIGFVAAVLYLGIGIYQRSSVMGRPPVGNIYDTIPFITFGATVILGLAEWMTRRRLLLALGSALGTIGVFMAFRFEFGDAKDHMDPLNAVLNSNYWLSTHVVTITLGYAGGLVACFLSQIYVHLRLAGLIEDNKKFQRFVTRAVYGVVCFTLLFSLVGTVLGGIWANDSWGRFWGWDPKENGALLIVLWCLIILHCRLAGWVKDWGIHFLSIFMGIIVAFSWWHTNLLGVGLHSYGFTEGRDLTLYKFYGVEVLSIVVGVVAYALARSSRKLATT